MPDIVAGPWSSLADLEQWWAANAIAHNRLAVTDPDEWERITRKIELFRQSVKEKP